MARNVSVTNDDADIAKAYRILATTARQSSKLLGDESREWPVQGILRALLDFAPSIQGKKYVAGVILRTEEEAEDSAKLADGLDGFAAHWIGTVLLALKANGGKTPAPSQAPSPSPDYDYIDRIDEYVASATRGDQKALRQALLIRQDFRDPVTGEYDIAIRQAPKVREAAEKAAPDGEIDDRYELVPCHIIPFALNDFAGKPEGARDNKSIIWAGIRGFYPEARLPKQLSGELINKTENAILLSSQNHAPFGSFRDAYELQPDGSYTAWRYKLKGEPKKIPGICFGGTGPGSEKVELPDPRLLRLHWSIAQVLHASGAGEMIEEALRDLEEIPVLAEDGSGARLLNFALASLAVELKA